MSIRMILFTALYIVSTVLGETYTDWDAAITALESAKSHWLATGITDYVYRWQKSCFCMQCYIAPKYVVIENDAPIYVEFDEASSDPSLSCLPKDYIQSPLSATFNSISDYYDQAIAHATNGANACPDYSTTTTSDPAGISIGMGDAICGGSVAFTYDSTYYYLTSLSLNYGPFIADAGQSWTFSCLTPSNVATSASLASYRGSCDSFTMPSAGDSCGESGTDCAALRCACALCADGSGDTYGCCGCTIVETLLGELICSAIVPQADVCPDVTTTSSPNDVTTTSSLNDATTTTSPNDATTTSSPNSNFCGGVAGIQCEDDLYCVDDPTDSCDPDNGGADCGGICVAEGDSCEDSPDCPDLQPLCACGLCPDGINSYGCCGCRWHLNERGTDVTCSTITARDDVCPITTTEAATTDAATTDDATTDDATTDSGESLCDAQHVSDRRPSFDDSEVTTNGFGWCKFCVCRSVGHPQCDRLMNLYLDASDDTIAIFNSFCDASVYTSLQDADGNQCDFSNLRLKDTDDIENCWCDALYCDDNPFYQSGSRSSGNQVVILCIGFIVSFFWWM